MQANRYTEVIVSIKLRANPIVKATARDGCMRDTLEAVANPPTLIRYPLYPNGGEGKIIEGALNHINNTEIRIRSIGTVVGNKIVVDSPYKDAIESVGVSINGDERVGWWLDWAQRDEQECWGIMRNQLAKYQANDWETLIYR
jgi:hypothetical protein